MMVDNLGERSVPARREGRREAAAKHPNRSRCNLGDDGVLIKAGSGIAESLRPLLGISKTILIGSATTQGLNTNCLGSDAGRGVAALEPAARRSHQDAVRGTRRQCVRASTENPRRRGPRKC
jgi:hypothetical protein